MNQAPPYASTQFAGPQVPMPSPYPQHWPQQQWPGGQPQWPVQPPPQQAAQPAASEVEQQFNAWAEKHGVDLANFEGGVGGLLDAMREAAQQGFAAQDQLKAAKSQPVPAEPSATDVNWNDYKQWLTTDDNGKIVPVDNAPVQIPYTAVKQANDVAAQLQKWQSDPDAYLNEKVGSLVEAKSAEIAAQKIADFQQQQAREQELNSFLSENSPWLYVDGEQGKGLSPYGKKFLDAVNESEKFGVSQEHVLADARDRFRGKFVLDQLQQQAEAAQQMQQMQQMQQSYGQVPQSAAPQMDVQQQIAQYAQPQANGQPVNGQLPFDGGMNNGAMQYQPAQNGYAAFNGTPQAYQPQVPQAFGQAQAPQFTVQAPTGAGQYPAGPPMPAAPASQTQSFIEQHGIPAAALEPTQRSSSDAGSAIGTPANDQHIPDIDEISEESIRAAGLI